MATDTNWCLQGSSVITEIKDSRRSPQQEGDRQSSVRGQKRLNGEVVTGGSRAVAQLVRDSLGQRTLNPEVIL